jgi:hypothetical protein
LQWRCKEQARRYTSRVIVVKDRYLFLYKNGDLKYSPSGIDNDTRRVNEVLLDPWAGIDSGTTGTLYFDALKSRRENYIGQ